MPTWSLQYGGRGLVLAGSMSLKPYSKMKVLEVQRNCTAHILVLAA